MSGNPNKLSQFWQELKRRKVTRTITVYAAAAFVILELTDIVAPSLGLPSWTLNLIIFLLCVGFIIAVILSWIYDIRPEDGIVKTEPVHKITDEEIPASSNSWRIASYISFVVIVALIVLSILPGNDKSTEIEFLDKSIAVLPFRNDSPEETEMYFINGTMESILDNLGKIRDIRVVSRTSVEQYRDNPKSIPTIGEEMKVSYVVEGSGLKHGNNIRLTIQLIDAINDKHIWSNTYNRKTDEIFELQSEIAKMVAAEIKAIITPEEKLLIEKTPTMSLTANDFYQQGREEYIKFLLNANDKEALQKSQDFYYLALDYDSTFAKAYAGLAMTYFSNVTAIGREDFIYSIAYLDINAFDTVLHWVNRALLFDNQLPEAYLVRGNYYYETGQRDQALQDYNRAKMLNPSQWEVYLRIGEFYLDIDYIKALENLKIAASLNLGSELFMIQWRTWQTCLLAGFPEAVEASIFESLKLGMDSSTYYAAQFWVELIKGNKERQHEYLLKAYTIDSTNPTILNYFAESYINLGNYEEGLKYYKKSLDIYNKLGRIFIKRLHRIAYAFYQAGQTEEAEYYFDRQEEIDKSLIELNRPIAQMSIAYYDLAASYAFRGEKEKAMEIFKIIHKRSSISSVAALFMQFDPLLYSIRDDPEFIQIADDMNMKLQAEQERVRQWLEENDML